MNNIPKELQHPFLNPSHLNYCDHLKIFRKELTQAARNVESATYNEFVLKNINSIKPEKLKQEAFFISKFIFDKKIVELLELNLKSIYHKLLFNLREVEGIENYESLIHYYLEGVNRITQELELLGELGNNIAYDLLVEIFSKNKYGIPYDIPRSVSFNATLLINKQEEEKPNETNEPQSDYRNLYIDQSHNQNNPIENGESVQNPLIEQEELSTEEEAKAFRVLNSLSNLINKIYHEKFPPLPKPSTAYQMKNLTDEEINKAYVTKLEIGLRGVIIHYKQNESPVISDSLIISTSQSNSPQNRPTTPSSRPQSNKTASKKKNATREEVSSTITTPKRQIKENDPLNELYCSEITSKNCKELLEIAKMALSTAGDDDKGYINYILYKIYMQLNDSEKALRHLSDAAFGHLHCDAINDLFDYYLKKNETKKILDILFFFQNEELSDNLLVKFAHFMAQQNPPDYAKAATYYSQCKDKEKIKREYSEALRLLCRANPHQAEEYLKLAYRVDKQNKKVQELLLVYEYRDFFTEISEQDFYEVFVTSKTKELEHAIINTLVDKQIINAHPPLDEKYQQLAEKIKKFLEKAIKCKGFLAIINDNYKPFLAVVNINSDQFETYAKHAPYLSVLNSLNNRIIQAEVKKAESELIEANVSLKNNVMKLIQESFTKLQNCPEPKTGDFIVNFITAFPHCYKAVKPLLSESTVQQTEKTLLQRGQQQNAKTLETYILQLNILESCKQEHYNEVVYYQSIIFSLLVAAASSKPYDVQQKWAKKRIDYCAANIEILLKEKTISDEWRSSLEKDLYGMHLHFAILNIQLEKDTKKLPELRELIERHAAILDALNVELRLVFYAYFILRSNHKNTTVFTNAKLIKRSPTDPKCLNEEKAEEYLDKAMKVLLKLDDQDTQDILNADKTIKMEALRYALTKVEELEGEAAAPYLCFIERFK